MVGGAPLVVKLLEGTQGKGVVLAETQKRGKRYRGFPRAECQLPGAAVHQGGRRVGHPRLVDRRQGGCRDGAHGAEGEFRSNLHRGGTAR